MSLLKCIRRTFVHLRCFIYISRCNDSDCVSGFQTRRHMAGNLVLCNDEAKEELPEVVSTPVSQLSARFKRKVLICATRRFDEEIACLACRFDNYIFNNSNARITQIFPRTSSRLSFLSRLHNTIIYNVRLSSLFSPFPPLSLSLILSNDLALMVHDESFVFTPIHSNENYDTTPATGAERRAPLRKSVLRSTSALENLPACHED